MSKIYTIVSGQTPSRGYTLHSTREAVRCFTKAHRRHMCVELSRGGQFDQCDVIVDGEAAVVGVPEDL